MEYLLIFFLMLVTVTLLGHGIWVLLALLGRSILGQPRKSLAKPKIQFTECKHCGASLLRGDVRCDACGLTRGTAAELADLKTTLRQLQALHDRDLLDPSTFERLRQVVVDRRVHLLERKRAEPPRPQAAPVQEVVVAPAAPVASQEPILDVILATPAEPAATAPRRVRVPPVPVVPRRSLSEWMAAFLEQRNIFWGELVGGLLMVGCSLALVISLWHKLEDKPLFPFLLLAGISSLLFGAGQYTFHRLKLPSTGRGLLVIATLLVPLSFLMHARRLTVGEVEAAASTIAALAVFAWLLNRAATVLLPHTGEQPLQGAMRILGDDILLPLAVLGASAAPLAVPHLVTPTRIDAWCLGLAAWPVACHFLGVGAALGRRRRLGGGAATLLGFVGLASFALFLALGFQDYWIGSGGGDLGLALQALAPLFALAAVPGFVAGLHVRESAATAAPGTSVSHELLAGTLVALAEAAAMLAAVALAWPSPEALLLVCTLNAIVLTLAAFWFDLPPVHAPALVCMAVGFLAAYHLGMGHLSGVAGHERGLRLAQLAATGTSGAALALLAGLLAAVGDGLRAVARSGQSLAYRIGACAVAVVSLAIVTADGMASPTRAALVFAALAVSAEVLGLRWGWRWLEHATSWLGLGTVLWSLQSLRPGDLPVWTLALAATTLVFSLRKRDWPPALAATVLTLFTCLVGPAWPTTGWHTLAAFLLAAAAFLQAGRSKTPVLSVLGSLLLLAGVGHALMVSLARWHPPMPVPGTFLIHASVTVLAAFGIRRLWSSPRASITFATPLTWTSLASCVLAALALVPDGDPTTMGLHALAAFWLAGLWVAHAVLDRRPAYVLVAQASAAVAVLYGVTAVLPRADWVADRFPAGLLDPRSLQIYGLGLTALCGLSGAARLLARTRPAARFWMEAAWPGGDRLLLGLLVAAQAGLAVWAVLPGVAREFDAGLAALPTAGAVAFGPTAWLLLASLAVVLLGWLREVRTAERLAGVTFGLVTLAATIPVLAAGPAGESNAAASALRWGLAACFLGGSAMLWLRRPLAALAAQYVAQRPTSRLAFEARLLLTGLTALPALALSVCVAGLALNGERLGVPLPGSLFASLGPLASWAGPLALVAVALAGHALRERSPGWAFAGGLITMFTVTGGQALVLSTGGRALATGDLVALLQTATLVTGLWAVAWQAIQRLASRGEPHAPTGAPEPFLALQVALAFAGCLVLAVIPLADLVLLPGQPGTSLVLPVGRFGGWLALGLTLAAIALFVRGRDPRWQPSVAGGFFAATGVLLACLVAAWDRGNWLAFHTLTLAWLTAGLGMLAIHWWSARRSEAAGARAAEVWVCVLVGLASVLALRGAWTDPARPVLSAGVLLGGGFLLAALAASTRYEAHVAGSGLLGLLTALVIWIAVGPPTVVDLAATMAIGLALTALAWTVAERVLGVVGHDRIAPDSTSLPFARLYRHAATMAAVALMAVVAAIGLAAGNEPYLAFVRSPLAWAALAAAAAAVGLCAWDAGARFPLPALYAVGLTALTIGWQAVGREGEAFLRGGALLLSAYVLLTAALATLADRLGAWRIALGLPSPPDRLLFWFAPAEAVLACVPLVIGRMFALGGEAAPYRFVGALATALLVPAGALLARRTAGRWGHDLRYATLIVGVVLCTELGWAAVAPTAQAIVLHRLVAILAALALGSFFYGFGLPRLAPETSDWRPVARRTAPWLGLAACLVLVPVLVLEGVWHDPAHRSTPLAAAEVAAVLVAVVGLIGAGIGFAVVPWADPFRLSERRRPIYVYAAELLAVAVFLHLRMNGWLLMRMPPEWWAFVVMAIAFAGVGLGEFFQRRRLHVLAEPIRRTGLFLPLLPLLAFWLREPAAQGWLGGPSVVGLINSLPAFHGAQAMLWLLFGLLYAWMAVTRRSFGYTLAAALAANVALWTLFQEQGWAFLAHPQLWLVPLALIVLASEAVNRGRLSRELATGLRYLGLGMLYLSSTADLFLARLSPGFALVLAFLAVLGVLAGIALRVRSYLYLGVGFLVLALFSMVWHAAVDLSQVWVWWLSGIGLGAAILVLFALFEKRRVRMLQVLDDLRTWQ